MPLEIAVVERRPVPDGARFWDTLARILSRATRSTAAKIQARAPHGKSGKLSRRVDVRVKRVNQGFVQGVEADFIVPVSYGHLVGEGHRIIARGPAKGAVIGSKIVIRNRLRGGAVASDAVTVPIRENRRVGLRQRRGRGSLGFVPGNPFASQTLREDEGGIVQAIEGELTNAV